MLEAQTVFAEEIRSNASSSLRVALGMHLSSAEPWFSSLYHGDDGSDPAVTVTRKVC